MSTLGAQTSKVIPQRNLDLVIGYCRNKEKEYNLHCIPMIVKYKCLKYLNQNKDEFYKFKGLSLQKGSCNVESDEFTVKVNEGGVFYQIFGKNIVKQSKHVWKFQFIRSASCWTQIGIESVAGIGIEYSLLSSKYLDALIPADLDNESIQYKIKDGDIIEMKLDCLDWVLSFTVNGMSVKIAVKKGEYRIKISITTMNDSCYKMLSYQMTY